jgi:hypothetical protein
MKSILSQKLAEINRLSIKEIYQMPIVKQGDFRLYKEAVGIVSEQEK